MNTDPRFDFSALSQEDNNAATVDELNPLLEDDLLKKLSAIVIDDEVYFPVESVADLASNSGQALRQDFIAWYPQYRASADQLDIDQEEMLALMEDSLAMRQQIRENRAKILALKTKLSQKP